MVISVNAIAGGCILSSTKVIVASISIAVGSSFLCSGLLLGFLVSSAFGVLADLLLLLLLDNQVGTVAGTWLRLVDVLVDRDYRVLKFAATSRILGSLGLLSNGTLSVRVGLQEANGLLSG